MKNEKSRTHVSLREEGACVGCCVLLPKPCQERGTWGRVKKLIRVPDAMEGRPWWKQGAWASCLMVAFEEGGVKRDCNSDQEQEEENITRGQGRRGPAPQQQVKATDKNMLWGVSRYCWLYAPFLCPQTSNESCFQSLVAATRWGAKQERDGPKFQNWYRQQKPRLHWGSWRQQQRGKLCRSDPEQKWPTILSTRNRGGWPGRGRQSPDPSLLLKTELFSRHMGHKDIAL